MRTGKCNCVGDVGEVAFMGPEALDLLGEMPFLLIILVSRAMLSNAKTSLVLLSFSSDEYAGGGGAEGLGAASGSLHHEGVLCRAILSLLSRLLLDCVEVS